ncbi:MAG: FIST C-terminal domain-containing protein [Gemmataceae bacterium]|nr:FIST C-terminal domain-containing protein [Gemmataceae bacterium]
MPFLALVSTHADTGLAIDDLRRQLGAEWSGGSDAALVFFSRHHLPAAEQIAEALSDLNCRAVAGCPGETVVANDREIEDCPALCLWLARWHRPVQAEAFHLSIEQTSEGFSLLGWPDALVGATPSDAVMLILGDPFSFPVDDFLDQVNESYPGLRVVGGMASSAREPGLHRLIVGDRVVTDGAVGILLEGPIGCRSVVSQGCRPIGQPFIVTKARDNLILELGGKPALLQLQELWQHLSPRDQQLAQRGLHLGRAISEYQSSFQRGDFLVRNVIGIDRGSGAIAITDRPRIGQTIQFHVRDAATADEDLRLLLQADRKAHPARPGGALLFSCNGRGTRLFAVPNHDAAVIQRIVGPVPLAGFFAQGEIGPVGGQNFIHGFTASAAIFDE